ncbi:GPI alpha-1,2-mannosyltransferase 4-like [Saccoglossus kowalevskii]
MLLSTISTRLVVAMTEYWWITLRIILVILPQNGFVYPDEFFQNPEVIAGDVFGYEVYTPWEYNNNSPCRNILFPLISSAVPFILLKILNIFFKDIVTTYTLLIFPRMFMLLVSFILDYCICILCKLLNINHRKCQILLTTSFITYVFHCRTFSNSFESILYAVLLVISIQSIKSANEHQGINSANQHECSRPTNQHECSRPTNQHECSRPTNQHECVKSSNDQLCIESAKYQHISYCAFKISLVTVFAFFVRPTFLFFAPWPILYFMYHIVEILPWKQYSSLVLSVLCGATIPFVFCILLDSCYYTFDISFMLQYGIDLQQDFVITPLNFMKYNSNIFNFLDQGIDPYYKHFVYNIPIVFLPIILSMAHNLYQSIKHHGVLPWFHNIDKDHIFLTICILFPVMCLSLCPHQEVRFIIPTLTPLILLYSKTSTDSSKYLITLWICWNVVCGSIFGIVHEGGLLKSLGYIRDLVNDSNNVTSYDFIFYHTYTPPKHLLAYNPWLTNRPLMTIHSLPSLDESHLHNTVTRLMTQWPPGYHDKFAVYVLSPSPLQYIFDEDHDEYKYQIREQFYPHFSVQDPPDFHVTENGIFDFLSQFSLILYKVELDHTLVT